MAKRGRFTTVADRIHDLSTLIAENVYGKLLGATTGWCHECNE